MTILTIEISEETYTRLEQEANQRGVDVATYIRDLLHQEASSPGELESPVHSRDRNRVAGGGHWPSSPEAIVEWLRSRRGKTVRVHEARANLADLLAKGGVDQGIPVEDWENRWADHEVAEKAFERADEERTRRELEASLADNLTG